MAFTYTPRGVCSRKITFDIEDGLLKNVRFQGGCHGNSQGVAALAEGMPAEEAVRRLSGHPLRPQIHLLPGSAGQGRPGGLRATINPKRARRDAGARRM